MTKATTKQAMQKVHDWTNGKIVYDISVAHPDGQGNPTPYADLTAALGVGGANIPEPLQRGGMEVKFIKGSAQSSDNNYVQYRLMADEFSTVVTDWQGIENVPTPGSKNIVDSNGIAYLAKTMPMIISPAAIQIDTWLFGIDRRHICIPVKEGFKVTWDGVDTLYYALLTEYPVIISNGDSPSFVTDYTGRQTRIMTKDGPLIIPEGCKYLIVNINTNNYTSIKVNGYEVLNSIFQAIVQQIVTDSIADNAVTFEKLNAAIVGHLNMKTATNNQFVGAKELSEVIEGYKRGFAVNLLLNLFDTFNNGYIDTDGNLNPSTSSGNYLYSDKIAVSNGQKLYYTLKGSNSVCVIAAFDSNDAFISSNSIVGINSAVKGVFEPSTNTAYIRLCCHKDYLGGIIDITEQLYAFKDDLDQFKTETVTDSDITIAIVSNNIANPANVWNNTLIDATGILLTKDAYTNYKAAYIEVSPGDVITVGGNDDGCQTYYALFDVMPTQSSTVSGATTPIDNGTITQQKLIDGKTITVPNNCHYLFWQLQFNNSPASENVKIQANRGNTLLPYDAYQEAITSINGIPLASAVPSDLEERVEQLESDVEDLQGQVLSSLIADLPVSADGSGIDVGYAYINSSTGVVTVKLS